jgi:DNA-binding MarR family transcriptional regulator
MVTVSELAILMALRVRGRGDPAAVARSVGAREGDVAAPLAALADRGLVASVATPVVPGAVALTDCGRAELARLLAAEPTTALAALYERFLVADRELKAAITTWQLAAEAQKPAARDAVMASAATVGGVAAALAQVTPRLAPSPLRIADAAAAIATGDARFVASPRVDSLHQVWFELHEDLLVTLGRSRGS